MNHQLSKDQFAALEEVSRATRDEKPSACVARNAKYLLGIKFLLHGKGNHYVLSPTGTQALFVKNCIAGLQALAADADTTLDSAVATFLGRKGHIVAGAEPGHFAVTDKGRECLADIAQNP
ncbi:MAG: hypothetical protein HY255_03360 [Betaproteobacteria bacterium]|nr:hypothetical protein [Betaproteobacteria bacterium]